jgi:hypothetical protein
MDRLITRSSELDTKLTVLISGISTRRILLREVTCDGISLFALVA